MRQNYEDNPNLKILDSNKGVVRGSNPYSNSLMNDILSKYGLRSANPADVQKIIDNDEYFLDSFFVNLGTVLRTEDFPNLYLSQQLGSQSKERGYKFSKKNPLVFKPSDLELILDKDSNSGLGFKIKDSATPFNAKELKYKNHHKKFATTNEKGIPVFNKKGGRVNRTRGNGLSRFGIHRMHLVSEGENLETSNSNVCRIVAIND